MNQVFTDSRQQSTFKKQGYVVVPDLLSPEDLLVLAQLFARHKQQCEQPFHTSHFSKDTAYKRQVHNTIIEVVFPKVNPILHNFRAIFGNYMVKNSDPTNFLQMHADWTYVEEPQNRSVSVWIPLVNTNETNGCLGVIEGSHLFMNKIRGPRIQQNSFDHDRDWVKKYGKLLPINAGDAVIYDHALLHFSPANTSQTVRPAINLSLVPMNVPVIHFCVPEGIEHIQKYAVPDDNFFLQYNNFQIPETGYVLQTIPINSIEYIDKKMERLWLTRLLNTFRQWRLLPS